MRQLLNNGTFVKDPEIGIEVTKMIIRVPTERQTPCSRGDMGWRNTTVNGMVQ